VDLNNLTNLTLVAIVGALAGFWGQVKGYCDALASLFVGTLTMNGRAANAVNYQLFNKCKLLLRAGMSYEATESLLKSKGRRKLVAYEQIDQRGAVFLVGWTPIWVTRGGRNSPGGEFEREGGGDQTIIHYLRLTLHPDKFMTKCIVDYNKVHTENVLGCRYYVKRVSGNRNSRGQGLSKYAQGDSKAELIHNIISSRPVGCTLEDIVTGRNQVTEVPFSKTHRQILEDARWWMANEAWYTKRGIPWRRGYILHGPPGSGKTCMAKMLAKRLDVPIIAFDLPSFANDDFSSTWRNMAYNTPCIALIEDFDSVFEGRKNVTNMADNIGLTFDCLLNMVDGAEEFDGLVLVITTNKIASVDPALAGDKASRPGRVDKVYEVGFLDGEGALNICERMLPDATAEQRAKIASQANHGQMTAAVMVEMCRELCADKAEGKDLNLDEAKQKAVRRVDEVEQIKQNVIKDNLASPKKPGSGDSFDDALEPMDYD